ncbi:ubiquitin thioesterase OTU1 [Hyaloscypha variabilis]|uniref:Ubiquitin thioesterase OTU n=1 Tax=Hyaloscypha variabilis (strain UAMH 11265 / GT02V1 / F) TaxID=1149755 RepID=A0A2J6RV81_HYAVF|nr:ubiquitin thioesterase OTU1 [Hyaloscypha variabilis F]
MRTRLRAPGGASTVTLPDDATVGDLIAQITEKTSLTSFDVKYGYPPKPLLLEDTDRALPLSKLVVKLDGEQLTISAKADDEPLAPKPIKQSPKKNAAPTADLPSTSPKKLPTGPVSLQRKAMEGDVPTEPFAERNATVVLRVMPDDNSCLFRAFSYAVLPTDDKVVVELRSIIAQAIRSNPELYTKVVLEQEPENYCQWIQTQDAWGGAIELGILAQHFEVEICSIDVQSGRVDKYNEGALTRCILVYSGIHYDTIVSSPSDYPHSVASNPPEFDTRIWDSDDAEILEKAKALCKKLNAKHYYTDTGGMAIKCKICGIVVYGEAQAGTHAQQTGHYDMAEVTT